MPKHVGVDLERINNKKIHYFLEHLLVLLHTMHIWMEIHRINAYMVLAAYSDCTVENPKLY
jgi:hypothetical protein